MTKILVRQHGSAFLVALLLVAGMAGILRGFELRLAHSSNQVLAVRQPSQGFVGTFAGEASMPLPKVLTMQ